jgi:hypothetical protein
MARSHARRLLTISAASSLLALPTFFATPASAHPHVVTTAHQGVGQVIANGQNHAPFVNGESCGGDPAAYGLETAHHGPDAGTPGRGDGCYMTTGAVAPGLDVTSPVIG